MSDWDWGSDDSSDDGSYDTWSEYGTGGYENYDDTSWLDDSSWTENLDDSSWTQNFDDGSSLASDFNGDIVSIPADEPIIQNDGPIVSHNEDGSTSVTATDGTHTTVNADLSGSIIYPDGNILSTNPDTNTVMQANDGPQLPIENGPIVSHNEDGSTSVTATDGTHTTVNADLSGSIIYPDGNILSTNPDTNTVMLPNDRSQLPVGEAPTDQVTVYDDGSQLIETPEGATVGIAEDDEGHQQIIVTAQSTQEIPGEIKDMLRSNPISGPIEQTDEDGNSIKVNLPIAEGGGESSDSGLLGKPGTLDGDLGDFNEHQKNAYNTLIAAQTNSDMAIGNVKEFRDAMMDKYGEDFSSRMSDEEKLQMQEHLVNLRQSSSDLAFAKDAYNIQLHDPNYNKTLANPQLIEEFKDRAAAGEDLNFTDVPHETVGMIGLPVYSYVGEDGAGPIGQGSVTFVARVDENGNRIYELHTSAHLGATENKGHLFVDKNGIQRELSDGDFHLKLKTPDGLMVSVPLDSVIIQNNEITKDQYGNLGMPSHTAVRNDVMIVKVDESFVSQFGDPSKVVSIATTPPAAGSEAAILGYSGAFQGDKPVLVGSMGTYQGESERGSVYGIANSETNPPMLPGASGGAILIRNPQTGEYEYHGMFTSVGRDPANPNAQVTFSQTVNSDSITGFQVDTSGSAIASDNTERAGFIDKLKAYAGGNREEALIHNAPTKASDPAPVAPVKPADFSSTSPDAQIKYWDEQKQYEKEYKDWQSRNKGKKG